jgi:hypothetical protein
MRLLNTVRLLAVLFAVAASPAPRPVYGVTLDDTAGISRARLAAEVHALAALPRRPYVRVVADYGASPADYARALPAIHRVATTILELGDSSELRGVPPAAYAQWVRRFTRRYAQDVDVWEIGNEVNGEWVGPPAEELRRVGLADDAVRAIGGRTMVTVYYNPGCFDRRANELFTWLAAHRLPAALDYVTISYYPSDCYGYWPSQAGWQRVFDRLHARFPRALLGFGEAGTSSRHATQARRIALWRRYRAVRIRGDRYVGLGLWWTWAEDAVPATKPFWHAFAASLRNGP